MSISRWIYEPFYSLANENAFDELLPTRRSGRPASDEITVRPRLDLHENPEKNTVTATFELPGLKKDDVKIDIHNNVLTVSSETSASQEKEDRGYAIRERRYGKLSRSVQIPQGVKPDDIKASMENGLLTVTFPKSAPESAPKTIAIA